MIRFLWQSLSLGLSLFLTPPFFPHVTVSSVSLCMCVFGLCVYSCVCVFVCVWWGFVSLVCGGVCVWGCVCLCVCVCVCVCVSDEPGGSGAHQRPARLVTL